MQMYICVCEALFTIRMGRKLAKTHPWCLLASFYNPAAEPFASWTPIHIFKCPYPQQPSFHYSPSLNFNLLIFKIEMIIPLHGFIMKVKRE